MTITLNKDETKLADNSSKVSWEDLLSFIDENAIDIGIEDLAHQHDHYLYGTPKKNLIPNESFCRYSSFNSIIQQKR